MLQNLQYKIWKIFGVYRVIEHVMQERYLLREDIAKLQKDITPLLQGIGRIIAYHDRNYGVSEFDPKRKAESDAISERVIAQLKAEDWARKHTTGEVE